MDRDPRGRNHLHYQGATTAGPQGRRQQLRSTRYHPPPAKSQRQAGALYRDADLRQRQAAHRSDEGLRRKVAALGGSDWRSVIRHSDHRGAWAAFIHASRGRLWSLSSLALRSERLSFVSRLLDEGEDVGDALVGTHGGNMVGIAPQDRQPRIGNELLVLPRLLDRLQFAL